MALRRYTTSVDGTIPVPALVYDDEQVLASQDNVGIYDGLQKAPDHQNGTIHVTSHRLFFIHASKPLALSFAMDLSHVVRTECYSGLFASSPKVTLILDPDTAHNDIASISASTSALDIAGHGVGQQDRAGFASWTCEVCNHRNPPGLSPTAAKVCALCGVPRSAVPPSSSASGSLPSSSSLPASMLSTRTATPDLSGKGAMNEIACPACTFLNVPSRTSCEICGTSLPNLVTNASAKSAPVSRPVTPSGGGPSTNETLIKLSFRKGGDKAFYTILRRSLKAQAWEGRRIGVGTPKGGSGSAQSTAMPGGTADAGVPRRWGIDAILRNVETSAQNTEDDLNDAFKDLDALMIKAKDLVELAGELNEKLTVSSSTTTEKIRTDSVPSFVSSSSTAVSMAPSIQEQFTATTLVPSTEPEEATFIRSSLSQLGLQMSNAPVTADMIKDERRWVEELARELAQVLQGSPSDFGRSYPGQTGSGSGVGIMKRRGIVALDEVWGGWNRARGVSLIPPSTFLQTLPHLATYTSPPIQTRRFKSGLTVLHTPPYTHAAFTARLAGYIAIFESISTPQVAEEEGVAVGLAADMVDAVEQDGSICRDDLGCAIIGGGAGGAGGTGVDVRWLVNKWVDYRWDGQE